MDTFTPEKREKDSESYEIEKIINPHSILFNSLQEFKLIDNSQIRGIFGVFLGLYKNLRYIKKVTFDTQDRNINVLLEECLPKMTKLKEIYLTSKAPKAVERFKVIKKFNTMIKKLTIAAQYVDEAITVFDKSIEIVVI